MNVLSKLSNAQLKEKLQGATHIRVAGRMGLNTDYKIWSVQDSDVNVMSHRIILLITFDKLRESTYNVQLLIEGEHFYSMMKKLKGEL